MFTIGRGLGFSQTRPNLARAAAILFSVMLGASPAFAAHGGGGGHGGGGFHGGGFHGGGFHGGGFHGGNAFHGRAVYAGGYRSHGYYGGRYYGGGWSGGGFYPGFGLGLALGAGYPWNYYYPAYGDYYGTAAPYAAGTNWYYCANPPGYYPYVGQCYVGWQTVPAS